jgi:hypothetical protein
LLWPLSFAFCDRGEPSWRRACGRRGRRSTMTRCLLLLATLGAAAATPLDVKATAPPPDAMARAQAAVDGLFHYYVHTERHGLPAPTAKHCQCFTCDGQICDKDTCPFCYEKPASGCASPTSPGCYTSNSFACDCNDPPPPLPHGANSAATFLFACGQVRPPSHLPPPSSILARPSSLITPPPTTTRLVACTRQQSLHCPHRASASPTGRRRARTAIAGGPPSPSNRSRTTPSPQAYTHPLCHHHPPLRMASAGRS